MQDDQAFWQNKFDRAQMYEQTKMKNVEAHFNKTQQMVNDWEQERRIESQKDESAKAAYWS